MTRLTEARPVRGWAMFTKGGLIFIDSIRHTRRAVVKYANEDAAPTWNWARYRKNGFFIAKVDIIRVAAGRAALERSDG